MLSTLVLVLHLSTLVLPPINIDIDINTSDDVANKRKKKHHHSHTYTRTHIHTLSGKIPSLHPPATHPIVPRPHREADPVPIVLEHVVVHIHVK